MFSDDHSTDRGSSSSSSSASSSSFGFTDHSFYSEKQLGAKSASSFLQSILAFEKAPQVTHFEQLVGQGVHLPDPANLSEQAVVVKLWEVVRSLAGLSVFLRHTDHLSDRELYELLWWDLLRQETVDTTNLPGTCCQLDILGGRDQGHRYLYLKYYADEQERRFHAEQYPGSDLPPHEDTPYKRDVTLPSS